MLFYWGGSLASLGAGRSIWLTGRAKGAERLALLGFRLAFVLALMGPFLMVLVPELQSLDPLWNPSISTAFAFLGLAVASFGSMIAFAAQMSMGASWRVGVASGETGAMVTGGLFDKSRNPTFVGHLLLLLGVAVAVPSALTLIAVLAYTASAAYQVRKEEQALLEAHGDAFATYCEQVPRWIGFRTNS